MSIPEELQKLRDEKAEENAKMLVPQDGHMKQRQFKVGFDYCHSLMEIDKEILEAYRVENKRLEADLKQVQESHKRQCDLNDRAYEQLKIAIDAVKFYASQDNWVPTKSKETNLWAYTTIYDDSASNDCLTGGKLARQTLEKLGVKSE